MVDLLSEVINCARERRWFAAGMWLKEAFSARDGVSCPRKKKLATKLLEAVLEAVEIAERKQTETVVAKSLFVVRPSGPARTGVGMGLSSAG